MIESSNNMGIARVGQVVGQRWHALSPWLKIPIVALAMAAAMLAGIICFAPPGTKSSGESSAIANPVALGHKTEQRSGESKVASTASTQTTSSNKSSSAESHEEPTSPRNDFQAAMDFLAASAKAKQPQPKSDQSTYAPGKSLTGSPDTNKDADKPNESPAVAPAAVATKSAKPDEKKVDEFAEGGGLEGRQGEAKYQLVQRGGASPRSEECVSRGLKWLVAHQRQNGSWRFDHHETPCYDRCSHPGSNSSTTASTALALLCFYGAGYTHKHESEYKEVVNKGLYYLGSRMLMTPDGGDLQEGTMYAQGLGAIVLCEAYAMSGDENLKPFAQAAIDFIVYSQDKIGGGWRYFPGQPGDTSSFGWQIMALKSAKLAGLRVPPNVIYMSTRFLDSVETDAGAGYGYQTKKREPTTSSIGLLCRMYTGWTREHDGIKNGIKYLVKEGPSKTNLYYDYYATQCLHNWDGAEWFDWNKAMRDHLIATQATQGHESGSWWFDDEKTKAGGRLYNTCMAIMTLEVYYRYMPLNNFKALEGK